MIWMKFKLAGSEEGVVCVQVREVRWGDCDAAGIVYYARFFDWFTDGRIALLKQIGLPYQQFFHEQGVTVVAVEASCRYKKTLKPEEKYILRTTLSYLGRTRMIFDYLITKPGENPGKAAGGRTTHAYVDVTGRPFDLKKKRPALWEKLLQHAGLPENK